MKTVVVTSNNASIDTSEIPNYAMDGFARGTLRALERFFELPGIQEEYEEWLKEYRKKQSQAVHSSEF